ncbi:MAG: hypothetical protein H6618_09600 [Deltaproteobacteria bacterium]|nr:hypothetical protein [Deltaproteobacteria bacterium]
MNKRDEELDSILDILRQKEPTELQMARWKKSLVQKSKRFVYQNWLPLVASLSIGFVLGMGFMKLDFRKDHFQENIIANATKVERFINIE